jgi:hypothetical protein
MMLKKSYSPHQRRALITTNFSLFSEHRSSLGGDTTFSSEGEWNAKILQAGEDMSPATYASVDVMYNTNFLSQTPEARF